jgi:hypothetical protein
VADLAALEAACVGREPVFPTAAPPAGLLVTMQGFAQFAEAVRLTPASDLASLMAAAEPRQTTSALAVSRLHQRADAFDVMVRALRSDDAVWQGAGAAMAYASAPMDERLPKLLVDIITTLPLTPRSDVSERVVGHDRVEELLAVIIDQSMGSSEMLAALAALQRNVARTDPDLARTVGFVLRELHGMPATRTRAGFLP